MAYASWSVVANEQPSASKWNILGTNDAAFNSGGGVLSTGLDTNAVTLGYAQVTSAQTGITSITDLTSLSVTVTVPTTGRYLVVHGHINSAGSTVNLSELCLRESSTVLSTARIQNTGTGGWTIPLDIWYNSTSVSPGSHTYKLSLNLTAGTGTVEAQAGLGNATGTIPPNFIWVGVF